MTLSIGFLAFYTLEAFSIVPYFFILDQCSLLTMLATRLRSMSAMCGKLELCPIFLGPVMFSKVIFKDIKILAMVLYGIYKTMCLAKMCSYSSLI